MKKKLEDMKNLEDINILMDESALRAMFEGKNKNKSKDLMVMMKKMNDEGKKLNIKVPMSHFLRAIFLSDSKIPIKNIQKVLSFIKVVPSFADFKDKKACINEILMIAKVMQGEK